MILQVVLDDLFRQVQVECSQRGILLKIVHRSLLDLIQVVVSSLKSQSNKMEAEYQAKIKDLHAMYQAENCNYEKQVQVFQEQIKDKDEVIREQSKNNHYL